MADTSMISPVRPLGLGGGGCLRGSVGLSDVACLGIRLTGGGVIGRGILGMGGEGDGDGGLPRGRDFVAGAGDGFETGLALTFLDRGSE